MYLLEKDNYIVFPDYRELHFSFAPGRELTLQRKETYYSGLFSRETEAYFEPAELAPPETVREPAISVTGKRRTGNYYYSWNLGEAGIGLALPLNINSISLFLNIFDIFIEHRDSSLGLEINLLRYRYYPQDNGGKEDYLDCLNLGIYYNLINKTGYFAKKISPNEMNILGGPFVSANYLSFRDWKDIDYRNFTVTAGFQFRFRKEYKAFRMPVQIVGLNTSWHNNSGKHKFYTAASVDLLAFAYYWANSDLYIKQLRKQADDFRRGISKAGF
ncbi:MAG: hypothetical protein LBK83_03365 [Treponema sp.]|jgi:hypothetical protein|nr:hypothetical protein [Treponema sp.]